MLNDRPKAGCDLTLIRRGSVCVHAQQHPIDRQPLRIRQLCPPGCFKLAEQIGQHGISQHRLGGGGPRRQHPKPALTCLIHGAEQQCGLADARLTLDQQSRGAA